MAASNPPADPPTPTMGQIKSFLLCGRLFSLGRADFGPVLVAFAVVRDAFFFAFRSAGIAAFYVNCGFRAHKLRIL
jgi:hypothetical protein